MNITKVAGIASGLGGKLTQVLANNPALASMLLGGALGAATAGERRRVRGAGLGAAAGLGAGLAGRGVRRGTALAGKPSKGIQSIIGPSTLKHQMGGAALGGTAAGALIQPEPTPVIMHRRNEGSGNVIERAMERVKAVTPEIERV